MKRSTVLFTLAIMLMLALLTAYIIIIQSNRSTVALRIEKPIVQSQGSYPFLPGSGRRYIIITAHFTNNTGRDFELAPVVQTYVTDSTGKHYSMAPAMLTSPIQAGTIAAGQTRSGELSYNVPDDSTGFVFHLAPNSSAKELLINL